MYTKPPISQKISPISIKYNSIITKPIYYSPKEKYSDSSTLPQKKAGSNDFTSHLLPCTQSPKETSNFHNKYMKKSGSNDRLKSNPSNVFDFKQQNIVENNDKEFGDTLMSTLRALRKETKTIKSEGDIHNYTNQKNGNDSQITNIHYINPSLYQETMNKDPISNETTIGFEPKPNKMPLMCQSTILDKSLPKFLRNINVPSPQTIKYKNNLGNYKGESPNGKYNGEIYKKNEIISPVMSNKPIYNGYPISKDNGYKIVKDSNMMVNGYPINKNNNEYTVGKNANLIKKPELVESFVNVISNDSDLKVKPIKNIEFSANPFANNVSFMFKPMQTTTPPLKNWKIEDFDLGKCLGKGRFGKVFLAREKKTRSLFALKCILKKGLTNQACVDQMIREIKIHSFLQHVNIIQFYGCFEDSLKIYLILEFALQGNLFHLLYKQVNQRFDESTTAGFLKQILEAIKYLHSNYIIHRDIKPENILVSNGILKIADFGWSIYAPEDKRTTFCGTVDYVAPEIVTGCEYDAKVDLWSLGVLCFELTTGKAPFENRVNREAFKNIVNLNYKFPEYLSDFAKDFINKLLVKDPARRLDINEICGHPFLGKAASFSTELLDKKLKEFKDFF